MTDDRALLELAQKTHPVYANEHMSAFAAALSESKDTQQENR